jgi:uncharacterized protein YaaN involved in tellurite resistance
MAPLAEQVLEDTFTLLLAIQEQENIGKAIDDVQKMMENLIESNTERVGRLVDGTIERNSRPLIALDKVKASFNNLNAAFERMEQSNRQIIENTRRSIDEISVLNDEAEGRITGKKVESREIQERASLLD